MLVCKKILIFCAFACCGTLFAQNIQNPVLPGVADAGVMKYNGKYYIGGVFTNGDFYVSDDLVHWGKPVIVVTMIMSGVKEVVPVMSRFTPMICFV